jgi:ABC-type oligopeptide transport system ATPase subunit
MNNPGASGWPRPHAPVPASRHGRSAEKNFARFMPGNPLISLDSDERIQGNPRKSNPHDRRFSQRNDQGPRKPKRTDRCRGPLPRRSQTDSIQRQSGLELPAPHRHQAQMEVLQRILIDVIGFGGVGITVDSTVANLSGGERQGIAIGRAMHCNADLIVLDKPTAALIRRR